VAVRDGKIAAIGSEPMEAGLVLDCEGLVVCPGFVDLHNHSDSPITAKKTRANVNYLLQGCTTIVTGNCGAGPIDVASYLKEIDEAGAGTHVAHLLPQGRLRDEVVGKANRRPTDEELVKMRELADKAMRDGAFGMTTGLIYIPGTFTETDELIEIAKVVGEHGGIYGSHIRGEGKTLLAAVEEAIRIGKEAGAPVHISHFKASGRPNWGTLRLAVELVEKARAEGQTVTADQYPYTASSTSLEATLLPDWCREGGRDDLKKRLEDAALSKRIEAAVADQLQTASRIQLASCRHRPEWIGKSLDEIAEAEGRPVLDIVMEIERHGGAQIVNFSMSEDDVRMAMALPWVATATDGGAKIPTAECPHPRSFGTFPRKIGRYAIEEQVLPLPAAIRSAAGLPAEILGLTDRGLLKVGMAADIAVFDPQTFRDRATFARPDLPPSGIRHVLVEGTLAVYDGQATGALAGHALRKTAAKSEAEPKAAESDARPADWAVDKLIEEVERTHGRGPTWSVDFEAYEQELKDLPIGVFDSGIGGLTVLEALLTTDLHDNATGRPGADGVPDLADEQFIYLGDQANMPYGNYAQLGKEDHLREHILKDSLFLLGNRWWPSADADAPRFDKPPVKAIVIACNTATAYGLEDLRRALEQWDVPVLTVGVVEAGANSVVDLLPKEGEAGAIAVLATTGTCSSGAYPRSIERVAGQRGRRQPEVIQHGSVSLAGVIEQDPAFMQAIESGGSDYRGPSVDNPQAPLDLKLLDAYGFERSGLLGDADEPSTWRLNSVDNYIRYDVATLLEQHRRSGTMRPIRYVMLGCTHFPFEAERIRAAFLRLKEFKDASGDQPYRDLISSDIELVDPAQLTAKELYRGLFQRRQLSGAAAGESAPDRLFFSVPAPDIAAERLTIDGGFTHDYKYGRAAGLFDVEDTRIVPLRVDRVPSSIGALIESRCPYVWAALVAAP
jgi:N-acyl-D-aspartate/D-glutamate deacylase/glutamate racemase